MGKCFESRLLYKTLFVASDFLYVFLFSLQTYDSSKFFFKNLPGSVTVFLCSKKSKPRIIKTKLVSNPLCINKANVEKFSNKLTF